MDFENNALNIVQNKLLIDDVKEYGIFLQEIKDKIVESRITAAKSVNRAFIGLYWHIGKMIVEKQNFLGWGKSVVEILSKDLKHLFPDMTGLSQQKYMAFASNLFGIL